MSSHQTTSSSGLWLWRGGILMICALMLAGDLGAAERRGARRDSRKEEAKGEKSAAVEKARPPTGLWRWTLQTENGQIFEHTAKLTNHQGHLVGVHVARNGSETPIEDGTFEDDTVFFRVVRDRNGQKFVSLYQGTLQGNSLTGRVTTVWEGKETSRQWLASWDVAKPPSTNGINGVWVWESSRGGRSTASKLRLKHEGDKLTGAYMGRGDRETPIEHGKFNKDGEVTFDVTQEFGGRSFSLGYKGKLQGDKIVGSTEFEDREGATRTRDWEATREDEGAPKIAKVAGTWQWSATANGQSFEPKVRLKQDVDKVTGTLVWGEHEVEISEGRVKEDQISFTVLRERDGRKLTSKYTGKVQEDAIHGKIDSDWDGVPNTTTWEAKRMSDRR